jgi:hypothetical protein
VRKGVAWVGALTGVVALALALPAYAGRGDKTFEADGIGITFKYPSSFKPAKTVTVHKSAGSKAVARGAVALDKLNLITVSRYDLRVAITAKNLGRFKGEVDSVIGQLARKRVSGRRVDHGGLPGYEYVISLSKPERAVSRMSVLFDGAVEYLLNCQSTPPKRAELEAGCRKALSTLKRR